MRSPPKQPHEVILEREVELGLAGIALTARAATKLVVDAPALVTFGTNDAESSGRDDVLALGLAGTTGLFKSDCGYLGNFPM